MWSSVACPDDCDTDEPLWCLIPGHEAIHIWVKEHDRAWLMPDPDLYDGFDGGVELRLDAFDELVAMRAAQLLADGLWPETLKRVERWKGNGAYYEVAMAQLAEKLGGDHDDAA